jgi:hydroxyacylglutathione hydrolase
VPSLLSEEFAANPFMRADDPAIAEAVGMIGADPAAVFTEIRERKNNFKGRAAPPSRRKSHFPRKNVA